ncbi:hypothetical protein BC940DRAFT_364262 [Gongronella butleri]|nr:hypothetical protein BC940DRAFT_364262 [Gongronella butleri]
MSFGSWQDLDREDVVVSPEAYEQGDRLSGEEGVALNFDRFADMHSFLSQESRLASSPVSSSQLLPASPPISGNNSSTLVDHGKQSNQNNTTTASTASLPRLMSTVHAASHADNHATWTPPWKGPPLPWLSSAPPPVPPMRLNDASLSERVAKWPPTIPMTFSSTLTSTKTDHSTTTAVQNAHLRMISAANSSTAPDPTFPFDFSSQHIASFASRQHLLDHFIQWISQQAPESLWSSLRILDLRHQNIEAIHALDTRFPMLESLDVSYNVLHSMSGLPTTLRVVKAASNRLTYMDGFRLLSKLEYLDVSDNAIRSFEGMSLCQQCKTLIADNNKLTSCLPLQEMKGLVTLRLSGNDLDQLTLDALYQLETLDVSYNRITHVETLNGLSKLQYLNLDNNSIKSIALDEPLKSVRTLRLNHNRLAYFQARWVPHVRILYLDSNQLVRIDSLDQLPELSVLSVRDQSGQPLHVGINDLYSTTKLYLSGLPIKQLSGLDVFESLSYLELCAAHLEELPRDFATCVPRLTVLYLNDNYLKHIAPLRHCRSLRKLILINNRLKELAPLVKTVRCLSQLEVLDLRHNPLTYKLYAQIQYPSAYRRHHRWHLLCRYLAPEHDTQWPSTDTVFFQALPAQWQHRRLLYRAMFIQGAKALQLLDQVNVTTAERDDSHELLATLSPASPMPSQG